MQLMMKTASDIKVSKVANFCQLSPIVNKYKLCCPFL